MVTGTPSTITQSGLDTVSHMGSTYINIIQNIALTNIYDSVFIPDVIRITIIGGMALYENSIIYGFTSSNSIPSTLITWNVLFANMKSQNIGDYIDILLPDRTLYPMLFLAIACIPNGWNNKTIIDSEKKICSLPGTSTYFSINSAHSNADIGSSHSINIQGTNSIMGVLSRVTIAFEDKLLAATDKDYNDVIISISSAYFDTICTNDLTLK